jgi:hypothetical protein
MKFLNALFIILLSFALAQGLPSPQAGTNPILGVWQVSFEMDDGSPTVMGSLTVNPNGTYREEMTQGGQMIAFWEGSYTLSPDGTFIQTETNVSPQFCMQGQCEPNDPPAVTKGRINLPNPNTLIVSYQDPSTGQQESFTWQRANAALPTPQVPNPNVQNPQSPNPLPQSPLPQAPNSQANAPCTPQAGCWSGLFSNGDISLSLGNPGSDYLERGGTRFPLTLQASSTGLQGSFSSNGSNFPVNLEPNGAGILLTSGDLRFELLPAMQGQAQPSNPLGN